MANTSAKNAGNELLTRAVSNVTPKALAEEKLKAGKPIRVYFGIDPTGNRLHLGHSVPLRKMRAFQDAGHETILLIGSFTAMIGDPTGKDALREPLTEVQVRKNFETYKEQAAFILDMKKIEIRYNHEWLGKMSFAEIMQLSSHFTVQQMLQRDMFRERMTYRAVCPNCKSEEPLFRSTDVNIESIKGEYWPFDITCRVCKTVFRPKKSEILDEKPISPNEFLYPLMQGYDSVVLDVDCEIGGNDQLFNMLAGRKLQKIFKKREKFVLTTKLLEGTDGRKMSKTYDNCVYLTDEPDEMFGKIMRIQDNLIPTYFECTTSVPMAEVQKIEKELNGGNVNPKELKMRLAREIVSIYHGEDAGKKAVEHFDQVFSERGVPDDMPEVKVKKGTLFLDIITNEKLVTSKSEARRLIEQGGVKLDEKKVGLEDAASKGGVLKVGKRKFLKIILL